MSKCFGGSLWREGSLRAVGVGGSLDTVFGGSLWRGGSLRPVCVGGLRHNCSVLAVRFDEKASLRAVFVGTSLDLSLIHI